jgi:RHS repeat-associated protein
MFGPWRAGLMRLLNWKRILILALTCSLFFASGAQAASPTITSLSVTSGPVGTAVTVNGSNFGSNQGNSTVKFNGTTASVTSWGSSTIKVTVPSAATTGNVVVTVSGVASNGKNFIVTPYITSLSITSGAVGATVTITGTTFGSPQGTSTVKFNGTAATATTWVATSIVVTVPSGATTGNVVVTVSSQASNGVNFTVVPAPTISSLSPTTGAVSASVTINGSNFGSSQGSSTVKFNGTSATPTNWNSSTITVPVPSSATTGSVIVHASGVDSNGSSFTVVPAPSITSLSITTGAVSAAVTITGSNFGSPQGSGSVAFNGTTATVTSWGVSSIGVTVPSGATTGNVVVNASGVASNGVNFTVVPAPSITSLSPSTGAVGAEVAIAGANFGATQGSGSVSFNGTAATPTSWSASTIAVPVPSGATTGNVVVNASGAGSNGLSLTVVPAPRITSLSVTSGVVGTSVTITGTNLGTPQGSGTVSFSGTAAIPTSWSATSIAAPVPVGATTGAVVVSASGVASNGINFTVVETLSITNLSPTTGAVGDLVTITGTGFGATQGTSTISFNGTSASVVSWSDTSITTFVPSGASSGPVSVTVNSNTVNSASFTVTALPSGWSDGDVGSVGVAGSASYANGVFTVSGAGQGADAWQANPSADAMHFVYQSLSGDGSIVARVVSLQGANSEAGVMIRETLNAGATNGYTYFWNVYSYPVFGYRLTTSGSSSGQPGSGATLPYWVKVVRSGNTFGGYASLDGINWTQVGSNQTITMAQNVYIGLVVSSYNTSTAVTGTFDSVSVNSAAAPAPVISGLSSTTGSIGSQVTITGTGFGATQNGSEATLNGAQVTINLWSATSITITIPTGATSGNFVVSVAPSMNDSNPAYFEVTSQPLPSSWLDLDIGPVGMTGSATYSNGEFTVKGAGQGIGYGSFSDTIHFVYQTLSGDGTIVARVVSLQGASAQAGVMIRETLSHGATNGYTYFWNASPGTYFTYRASTGGTTASQTGNGSALPYWIKVVRSGNTFSGYASLDGSIWTQIGASQTIIMAQNVYIGLAVSSQSTSALATATFDNTSVTSIASPAPVITSVSATTGSVGSQVEINGSGFGAMQNGSLVLLNDSPVTITTWSSTSISIAIPAGATSGYLLVSVAPSMNDSNGVYFAVTSQPLPTSWLDQDFGSVGVGSATYSNGVFTVNGSGQGADAWQVSPYADAMHFVYQPLSGDGTIVERVISLQGTNSQAGVMIRETLSPGATNAFTFWWNAYSYPIFAYRLSTGGGAAAQTGSTATLPYWMKLVRSGNTFSGYASLDGANWTQVGTTQTITMAQNAYAGLVVSSYNPPNVVSGTFDNVSVNSTAAPAPVINSVSATTGSIGSQVTITGTGFGATQNGSLVLLNDATVTINSWSSTSIVITIPTGATSGYMAVSVAPSMNDSNPVYFTVTTQPLPTSWLNQDIGTVGVAGSATYASGVFTVKGAGQGISYGSFSDGIQFVYQPLSGDGTIVARVVSLQGSFAQAGVMIRETLSPGATNGYAYFWNAYPGTYFTYRASTGGTTASQSGVGSSLPYWVKLIRNGNTFYGYASADGVTWNQIGASQTITMAQNVYVGFAVSSQNTSALATATVDNVAVTIGTTPFVTGLSPGLGGVGASVILAGSNFGAIQGGSTVSFNGALASSITSWSNTQIVAVVPNNATTGNVTVTVNTLTSPSNSVFTVVRPIISSITPPGAQIGATVTLSGSGFGVNPAYFPVSFNGFLTQGYNGGSDTTITVYVPSGATSGPVTVTEDGVVSNGVQFTVLEPLTITGISQSSGAVGTSVTIAGTGFGATQSNSNADFYGVTATVNSWSDTQIVVTVPAFAASGPLGVWLGGAEVIGPWFTLKSTVNLTDSLGNPTTYVSEEIGGTWVPVSSTGSGCSSCTVRGTIQKTYDTSGRLLTNTDELGRKTTYTYDTNGNVTSVSVPIAPDTFAVTTYTYNSLGEVLTTTDPMGNVTSNSYDGNGNLLSVSSPPPNGNTGPSLTQFTYNSLGELTQITDPLSNVTKLTYYPTGLINTITDGQQNVTTYVYDTHGNRTSVTDAMQNQTTFAYDTGDRLKTITYPGTTGTTTFVYDIRGRRTSVTDQNNKTTTYAYDDADRLTSVTDAATPGNVTTYGYDTENNLTSIKDANNNTTSFTYDAFGRVSKTTFPSSLSEYYYYDAVGNLLTKTDRKNQTITYTYDQLNRLTQKAYPDSTAVNYTYDNDSRLTQVTDPTGTYQFTFDNMGRLTQATTQYSFLTGRNYTTSYSYDAASNRTGFTDPENGSTIYAYDTLNRLQTLTPPAAFTATGNFGFSYDALSRRTQMTRPNGLKSVYAYDNLSRLLSVLHQSGSTTLDGASYAVDNAGNRTSRTPQPTGTASNYGYDALYELTSVTQNSTTTESYTYDPVGNRLSSLGVSSYSYNTSNQLTSTPNTTYTYDNNGNTATRVDSTGTTQYFWDFENRLKSVTLPGSGGTVSFKYDPFGRRIYKSSSSGTSVFAYDGDNLIEETNSSGGVVARYEDTQNIDEPLAMLRSGATSYYHADGLGSITSLSSAAGSIANTYTYDSYGKLTASTGSLVNPFRYTARESDTETGLYYYRARYYDPNPGRLLSEDPIDFAGGINFYAYVQNDPLNLFDPLGLRATKAATADCIAQGLQAFFPGVAATVGPATKNVGGHWNFPVQFQFPSYAAANGFYNGYMANYGNVFGPPARFGSGPAVHLENLGPNWSYNSDTGVYSINATAHLDLFNPNPNSEGGGGPLGLAGHAGIDGIVGHLAKALGSNIDPAHCPWGKTCTP